VPLDDEDPIWEQHSGGDSHWAPNGEAAMVHWRRRSMLRFPLIQPRAFSRLIRVTLRPNLLC
jgi:hypothetical protein